MGQWKVMGANIRGYHIPSMYHIRKKNLAGQSPRGRIREEDSSYVQLTWLLGVEVEKEAVQK
jgi:hypothetical protein